MATVRTDETAEVFIPRQSGEDPCVYVGVNGRGYQIQRGRKVRVPRSVAVVLQMAQEAAERAEAFEAEEQRKMYVIQGAPM